MIKRYPVPVFGLTLFLIASASSSAYAGCTFIVGIGNDQYVCDSGTSAALVDLNGNNSLTLPPSGTGVITGNVSFGAGRDAIQIGSGVIGGSVDQGDGADTFEISGGQIVGNLQQGAAIDDFKMTGGSVGSVNQGDGLDTFFMSGGRIVDYFEDGDYAVFTGGRIGRVNMKLDDNYFEMTAGVVDRNVVTGLGRDTIIISGGTIGGNISTSSGVDSVTVTGGSIGNGIKTGEGNDVFSWSGGIIYNAVILENGDDTASLSNLTRANMGGMTQLSGGTGSDSLTFSNIKTDEIQRFVGWESILANTDTELTFDGTLLLGDAVSGTGTLSIDASSKLFAGGTNSAIAAFDAGQLSTLANAGIIDLTNGSSLTDSLTVFGNYSGANGSLLVDTVLGNDTSASDKLVISGGTASGLTGVTVFNRGGLGDLTVSNGIPVVQAINGASTGSGTFALTDTVSAGAYEYYLFKGGVTAGSEESWYLRSSVINSPVESIPAAAPPPFEIVTPVAPEPPVAQAEPPPPAPAPPPEQSTVEPPVLVADAAPLTIAVPPPAPPPSFVPNENLIPVTPAPVPGMASTTPPTSGATRVVADIVPLYRVEVPTYSVIAPAARDAALEALGTFHQRRGEQTIVDPDGNISSAWLRTYGSSTERHWDGTVDPSIDGHTKGFQAGIDVLGWEGANGGRNIAGLFGGISTLDADIKGQAIGWNDLRTGKINLDATSVGGYWTHISPSDWYIDTVVMGTWYGGNARSDRSVGIGISGESITASVESGLPLAISDSWSFEPQAQLIWQHLSLDDRTDRFSSIGFDTGSAVTGRIGVRLQGEYAIGAGKVSPYLKANLWHTFDSSDTVKFGDTPIETVIGDTSIELGGGVTYEITDKLSALVTASYAFDAGGNGSNSISGNVGMQVKW